MQQNMGIKLSCALFLFVFLPSLCSGQEFSFAFGEIHNEDLVFRNKKISLTTVNSENSTILHSEPIFEDVRFEKGCNFAAGSIPVNSIDTTNHHYVHSHIWLCVDKGLKLVFVFPLNTRDVQIDTSLCLFQFTDRISGNGHWYWRGAIDFAGNVVLEPHFSVIMRYGDYLFAIGADDLHNEENLLFDRRIVVKNALGKDEYCVSLMDDNPSSAFTDSLQHSQFQKAWELFFNLDFVSAEEAFSLSTKGTDKNLKKASKYNLRAISKLNRICRRKNVF